MARGKATDAWDWFKRTKILFLPAIIPVGFVLSGAQGMGAVLPVNTLGDNFAGFGNPGGATEASVYEEGGFFRDLGVEPRGGRFGGGQLRVDSPALANSVLFMPGFSRSLRPEEAELKFGRFYFDLISLSGSVLHTDNIDLTPTDRQGRTISILRMSGAAFYQFTEGLQFGVAGRFVYLPQKGEVGLAGFGIDDPLHEFTRHPIFLAQLLYEASVDEWDLEVFNRFTVRAVPSTGLEFDFEDDDRAGRYVFRDPFRRHSVDETFVIRSNVTGASASRLLPTETRLGLEATRTYWWYDREPQRGFLPDQRDRGIFSLVSERENLRFKPFASYELDRYDYDEWNHQVRGGLEGPLSDYFTVRGELGYFWSEDLNRRDRLWLVRLGNTPGPLTYHEISYGQTLTEPLRDLERTWTYVVRHSLNSTVTAQAKVRRTRFDLLDLEGVEGREWGAYAGLTAAVVVDGGIGVSGGYEDRRFDDSALGIWESWIGRVGIRHRSLQADLHYRYTTRDVPQTNVEYEEHVIMFTLTKFY